MPGETLFYTIAIVQKNVTINQLPKINNRVLLSWYPVYQTLGTLEKNLGYSWISW